MEKEKYNPYVGDLKDFIKHNSLTFEKGRRNTDLVVLCGYSLHTGAEKEALEMVLENQFKVDPEVKEEFNRVYDYANKNNYGDWWNDPRNKDAINAYTPPS